MKNPPIARCRDWTDCLLLLSADEAPACDTALTDARLQHVAAVSGAWYLWQADLLPKYLDETASVWIIGAERLDAGLGAGLARLLGLSGLRSIDIGPQAEGESACRDSLDSCAGDLPLPAVAFCFHPGLEVHPELIGPGLQRLIQAGVPLVGASYSFDEYERDAWVAGLGGLRLSQPASNPWALDPGNTGLEWGAWMWHVEAMSGAELRRPDPTEVARVRLLSEMVAHSRLQGLWPQPAPPGSSFLLPQRSGGQREMIHVFDGYYLDPVSRRIYAVDGGRLVPTETRVPEALAAAWPRDAGDMPRNLWAAEVKRRCLLQNPD